MKIRPESAPSKKRFGHSRLYDLYSGWTTKAEARKEATRLKSKGFATRVQKTKEGYIVWAI